MAHRAARQLRGHHDHVQGARRRVHAARDEPGGRRRRGERTCRRQQENEEREARARELQRIRKEIDNIEEAKVQLKGRFEGSLSATLGGRAVNVMGEALAAL